MTELKDLGFLEASAEPVSKSLAVRNKSVRGNAGFSKIHVLD